LLEFGEFVDPHLTDSVSRFTTTTRADAMNTSQAVYDMAPADNILHSMRGSERGRVVLEEMSQMQLAEQIDDTLYVHTDPNHSMMRGIINGGVDNVNEVFQTNMRRRLLD
jgi:uncharacterized protein YciU (UPF0263 family)